MDIERIYETNILQSYWTDRATRILKLFSNEVPQPLSAYFWFAWIFKLVWSLKSWEGCRYKRTPDLAYQTWEPRAPNSQITSAFQPFLERLSTLSFFCLKALQRLVALANFSRKLPPFLFFFALLYICSADVMWLSRTPDQIILNNIMLCLLD